MQAEPPSVEVHVAREFDATPQRVFDAWLDPECARRWLFATPGGEMLRAEIEPRLGGHFVFTERRGGEEAEHLGEFLQIDRPHRLVFAFAVPKLSPDRTRVTIEIAPADGGCVLRLTHEGVYPHYVSETKRGWIHILDGLAAALA